MPDANDKENFLAEARRAAADIVAAVQRARGVLEWGAATAMLDQFADTGDPVFASGAHEGLTKANLTNAVNSFSSLSAWYDGGHNTNLHSVAHG